MINCPDSEVPSDFTELMKCGENKTHLINLICEVMGGESIWVAEVFSENVELRIQK